ncbi:MAG: GFA family protein [Candidatus Saccharimonadales bacterium]
MEDAGRFGETAMGQTLSGGCLCGAIRYETDADPVVMVNCHCRDCQRAGGGAYAPVVVVPLAAVKLSGAPHYYKTVGKAGKAVERGFCPTCGSQVTVTLERMPDMLGVQAASLDDPARYKPKLDLFTASAQPWDQLPPDTEKRPGGF